MNPVPTTAIFAVAVLEVPSLRDAVMVRVQGVWRFHLCQETAAQEQLPDL
jgi:hypothetical protein